MEQRLSSSGVSPLHCNTTAVLELQRKQENLLLRGEDVRIMTFKVAPCKLPPF